MTDPEDQHPDSQSPTPDHPNGIRTSEELDSLSLAALVLPLPWYVWSAGLVYWVGTLFVDEPWARTIVGIWLLLGVTLLWRPVEVAVARLAFQFRHPVRSESERLDAAWSAVTRRGDVDAASHTLLIDESDEVSASGSGGRVIAVTRRSIPLPPHKLEAVLAHELGHQVAGYSSLRAVGMWYSLPARAAAWSMRNFGRVTHAAPAIGCMVSAFIALSLLGIILTALIFGYVPLALLGVVLLFLAPVVLAGVDRVGERNADRVAARWGYGAALLEVLNEVHEAERQEKGKPKAGLLSSQPAVADRIRSLERYLSRESS